VQNLKAPAFNIGPKPLPLTPTIEIAVDCEVFDGHIINDGVGDAIVSVYDLQIPPIPLIPRTTLPKGGMLSLRSAGRPMFGGFSWSSNASGVYGWIAGRTI